MLINDIDVKNIFIVWVFVVLVVDIEGFDVIFVFFKNVKNK